MNNYIANVCVLAYAILMTGMALTLFIWLWQDIKDRGKK
jgi:hypothetical protein